VDDARQGLSCGSCGTALGPTAKFCGECGAAVAEVTRSIDRLAAAPTDPGYVVNKIAVLRLRALLAQACGDDRSYRDLRDRYRAMATSLGFEGHVAMAETMN
jgi:adenylate cyclase